MEKVITMNPALRRRLDAKELYLLICITEFINKEGVCWPSNKRLLEETGWGSENTLQKVKQSLIKKNIIVATPFYDEKGKRRSNHYWVNTDEIYLSFCGKIPPKKATSLMRLTKPENALNTPKIPLKKQEEPQKLGNTQNLGTPQKLGGGYPPKIGGAEVYNHIEVLSNRENVLGFPIPQNGVFFTNGEITQALKDFLAKKENISQIENEIQRRFSTIEWKIFLDHFIARRILCEDGKSRPLIRSFNIALKDLKIWAKKHRFPKNPQLPKQEIPTYSKQAAKYLLETNKKQLSNEFKYIPLKVEKITQKLDEYFTLYVPKLQEFMDKYPKLRPPSQLELVKILLKFPSKGDFRRLRAVLGKIDTDYPFYSKSTLYEAILKAEKDLIRRQKKG